MSTAQMTDTGFVARPMVYFSLIQVLQCVAVVGVAGVGLGTVADAVGSPYASQVIFFASCVAAAVLLFGSLVHVAYSIYAGIRHYDELETEFSARYGLTVSEEVFSDMMSQGECALAANPGFSVKVVPGPDGKTGPLRNNIGIVHPSDWMPPQR